MNKISHIKTLNPFAGISYSGFVSYCVPIRNIADYSPFGVQLDGRTIQGDFYRRGFNGMEKDDEVKGGGNSYDFGARMYDSRVGRWWSLDPLFYLTSSISTYAFVKNCPIILIDPTGEKEKPYAKGKSKPVTKKAGTSTPLKRDESNNIVYDLNNADAYNCHSYAWHNSKGDVTDNGNNGMINSNAPKWDQNPADDIKSTGAVQLNDKVRNRVGDIVVYYVDNNANGMYDDGEFIDHSAVASKVDKYGNTEEVTGKMGESEIAVNHPGAPGYYDVHYETDAEGKLIATDKKVSRAYFRLDANIQQVGKVTFDSNMARPIKNEAGKTKYLIIQDLKTGEAFKVTGKNGKYSFHCEPTDKCSKNKK